MITRQGPGHWLVRLERLTVGAALIWIVLIVALAAAAPETQDLRTAPAAVWIGALATVAGSVFVVGCALVWAAVGVWGSRPASVGAERRRSAWVRGAPALVCLVLGAGLVVGGSFMYPLDGKRMTAPWGVESLGPLAEPAQMTGGVLFFVAIVLLVVSLAVASLMRLSELSASPDAAHQPRQPTRDDDLHR